MHSESEMSQISSEAIRKSGKLDENRGCCVFYYILRKRLGLVC